MMFEREYEARVSENNGIFTAGAARLVADNENATLKLSKFIISKVADAAAVGFYSTKIQVDLEGTQVPSDIMEQINKRIPHLFHNYGYKVEVFDIGYRAEPGFKPFFRCTILVSWESD